MGHDAISAASGSSFVIVGGDVSEDDGGEGIHLSLFHRTSCVERVLEKINGEKHIALYTRALLCDCTLKLEGESSDKIGKRR